MVKGFGPFASASCWAATGANSWGKRPVSHSSPHSVCKISLPQVFMHQPEQSEAQGPAPIAGWPSSHTSVPSNVQLPQVQETMGPPVGMKTGFQFPWVVVALWANATPSGGVNRTQQISLG